MAISNDSLAVVVVNFGSSALLEANLAPLGAALPDAQLIVVDNFSALEERARVAELARAQGWTAVLSDRNIGFGGGMNLGVERAASLGATHVLLVNPDARIEASDVLTLRARVQSDPLLMVSPQILRPDGSVWFAGADLYLNDGRIRSTSRRAQNPDARVESWLSGACLLLSLELWTLVGGFDPEYFLYWEDVDLSHRVVASGGRLAVCKEAVALHAEGGTQGEGRQSAGTAKSQIYYYYNIRNRLLFAARNLTSEDLVRWRGHGVRIAYEVLLQGGRRQFLRSLAPFGAAIRGVRDGRSIVRRELQRRADAGISTPVTGDRK